MTARFPPRIFRRIPFETEVRMRFGDLRDFVSQYSGNISLGGMFVQTANPPAPGSTVEVEFALGDGTELIRGRGKVVWARDEEPGSDLPPGMGVRFLELTPGSRELIFRVVDRYVRGGGNPFDLDAGGPGEPEDAAAPETDREEPPAAAGLPAGELSPPLLAEPALGPDRPEGGVGEETEWVAGARRAAEPAGWSGGGGEPSAGWSGEGGAERTGEGPVGGEGGASGGGSSDDDPAAAATESWRSGAVPVDTAEGWGSGEAADDPVGAAEHGASGHGAEAWRRGAAPVDPAEGWGAGAGADDVEDRLAPPAASLLPVFDERLLPRSAVAVPPDDYDPQPARTAAAGGGAAEAAADDEEWEGGRWRDRPRRRWPLWLGAALVVLVAAGAYWFWHRSTEAGGGETTAAAGEPGGADRPGAGAAGAGAAAAGETGTAAGTPAGTTRPETLAGTGDPAAGTAPPPAGPERAAPGSTAARTPSPTAAPSGAPARGVQRVTWERRDGATEVVVLADGALPAGAASHQRIGGAAPRELFRLRGIARPLVPAAVEVGSPQLQRVRAGHHPELEPDELHLVLDLAGPGVEVAEARVDGRRLVIRLEGR